MITVDANTMLALLPPLGVALLAILIALTVVIGPLDFGGGHVGLLTSAQEVFAGAYVRDSLTVLIDLVMMSICLLTILFGPDYLRPRGLPTAEFAAMLLLAITRGMPIG